MQRAKSLVKGNDVNIEDLLKGIYDNKLEIEKQKALENANNKYGSTNIEGIIGAVNSALNNNASMLAQTALSGGDIQGAINNIINSVLPAEIQKRIAGIQKM